MLTAVIFPRDFSGSLKEGVISNLPRDKYFIWTTSLPIEYPQIIIDSRIEFPINSYPEYSYSSETVYDPPVEYFENFQILPEHRQYKLASLRSSIQYWISENIAPDNFYLQLKVEPNATFTRRRYKYYLMYNNIPCYAGEQTILKELEEALKVDYGQLLVASYSIDIFNYPKWVLKEFLRDIYEMGELENKSLVMVEGKISQELYLFIPEILSDTEMNDIMSQIRERIKIAAELQIFPRRTFTEMIQTRQLRELPNGQFTFKEPVPNSRDLQIYDEFLKQIIIFSDYSQLFIFLVGLKSISTYFFIDKEIQIFCKPGSIIVTHETKFLPDFLKVKTLGRVQSSPIKIILSYPAGNQKDSMTFFDSETFRFVKLERSGGSLLLPPILGDPPADYTLATRMQYHNDRGGKHHSPKTND